MIKGILALFRSGLILNPMVFLGILIGFIAMATLDDDMLRLLYTSFSLYLLMFIIASAYVYFFKLVYFQGGRKVDWKETILSMVGHFLMFVISFICSMLFVMFISFGDTQEEQQEYQEIEKLANEIKQQEKALQENYNAILKAYEMPNQ